MLSSSAALRLVMACAMFGLSYGDVYMHAPRGSNDRNCEKNVNRNNGNRLFDSQNNAKGGYACPRPRVGPTVPVDKMYHYEGSKVVIEWTNQHGCGTNPMTGCEIVVQYACEDTLDPTQKFSHTSGRDGRFVGAPRDGTPQNANDAATDRIPENAASAKADTAATRRFGMHESFDYYQRCKQRSRNKGLFTADQNVRDNRGATATRQNPNGNRRGLECPEERDYYPYWEPNPWRDIAVITSNPERCPYYKRESQNVKSRGMCMSHAKFYGEKAVHCYSCPKLAPPAAITYRRRRASAKPVHLMTPSECERSWNVYVPVKWDQDSVATKALIKAKQEANEATTGGFLKQIVQTTRISGGPAMSSSWTFDKLAASPPIAAVRFQAPASTSMQSCKAVSTGDNYGCPKGYGYLKASKMCVLGGQQEAPVRAGNGNGLSATFYSTKGGCGQADVDPTGTMIEKIVEPTINHASTGGQWTSAAGTKLPRDRLGAKWEGFIKITQPGEYTFYTTSDDGSYLYVGTKMVVNNGGCHGMVEKSGTVTLKEGYHAVKFTFWENGGGAGMQARYSGPDQLTKAIIPQAVLFSKKPATTETKEEPLNPTQNNNFWRLSGYFKPKTTGTYGFLLPKYRGAKLFFNDRKIAEADKNEHGKWIKSDQALRAGTQYKIVATGNPGPWSEISVGVKLPDGTVRAPMGTGGKDDAYHMCSTKACNAKLNSPTVQTRATSTCDCADWPAKYALGGKGCQQPPNQPGAAPWCFCKPGDATPKTEVGKTYADMSGCPAGSVSVGGKVCFFKDDGRRNYADSEKFCQSKGATIASIHSQAENDAVRPLAKRTAYLGAKRNAQNKWEWVDGTKWDYTAPQAGLTNTREKVIVFHSDGRWHDYGTGTHRFGVICRKKITTREGPDPHLGTVKLDQPEHFEDVKPAGLFEGTAHCNAVCANTEGCASWTLHGNACQLYTKAAILTDLKDSKYTSGQPVTGKKYPLPFAMCLPEYAGKRRLQRRLLSTKKALGGGAMHQMADGQWMAGESHEAVLAQEALSNTSPKRATPKTHRMADGTVMEGSSHEQALLEGKLVLHPDEEARDESQWEEASQPADVRLVQGKSANTEITLTEEPPEVNVDCVDGRSSLSRENQLGNARGTANPDPAIPHGINANRYIWTVPNHVNENCVIRLRYNISTSDYWAWNNEGTPKTTSQQNARRRRVKTTESPIVQDPYVGLSEDPKTRFLALAVNTNQYGRTFQDRSYVFGIKKRPAGVAADAKIYNVGVRGKRGNIVQTYPAVEYDFVPNDLCVNKGDYVHFQWTGSDYNPARNPNDGEGAGDSMDVNAASRADRSNIVDQDSLGKIFYYNNRRRSNNEKTLQFNPVPGQTHHGHVGAGAGMPAGALNPWDKLATRYTGMFWDKAGKPDGSTVTKLAFLNQDTNLAKRGQRCKDLTELNAINNNNARERDPFNCAKLNAASDKFGQRTPYFDGGLVQMNKAGRSSYMSTRNNNFSNRNQVGFMCVKDKTEGTCDKDSSCQSMVEKELLSKMKAEQPDGTAKEELIQIEDH
jgi:hypothetical protein